MLASLPPTRHHPAGVTQVIVIVAIAGSGSGSFGPISSSAATRISATARLRDQLWSAGTTYQGACSVEVSREHVLVRGGEVVPERSVVEVTRAELPALLGIVEPLLQALALLVA